MIRRFAAVVSGLSLAAAAVLIAAPFAAAHPGNICGGLAGTPCGPRETCRIERPVHPDKQGRCVAARPRPQIMCNMLYQPVCGRDGKTYPNRCHARRADVAVRHTGVCRGQADPAPIPPPPTPVPAPTPTPPPGASQTMCPMIYQPVCGVDGKTYPNQCHATRAGAKVSHTGAC